MNVWWARRYQLEGMVLWVSVMSLKEFWDPIFSASLFTVDIFP